MGKITGFLEYHPVKASNQTTGERIKHYNEFTPLLADKEISLQGARCMDCSTPFCHSTTGCHLANLIPEWNDLVYLGRWFEAYQRLELTNNFPEFTGRVCPAPCETACNLAINDCSVTIKQIELAIIEKAFKEGWIMARPPGKESGRKIAIIGSGPAGLAAAQQLRRSGHDVTVFEKSPKIGGILRYGIPDFKLEKWVIDRRLEQMRAEGIGFETDINIGEDLSTRYLQKSFDVILLTVGAGEPRDLNVPGRKLAGIHFAMDYLTKSNMHVDGLLKMNQIITAQGRRVLIIGGGDTGSDCVGTARRQGAKDIYQYEILPKPQEWHNLWNPEWPKWPNILRTSTSHEEGCIRDWGILTKSFQGSHGRIKEANFTRVEWLEDHSQGNILMKEVPGSDFSLEIDLVLLAMGFVHVEHNRLNNELGIAYDNNGNIVTDHAYRTSVEGIFAAGDANIGASLVVQAIYHGREAAKAVDQYLQSG
jgi:glutamate synthase (NADPH/NADH) small chain